MREIIFVDVGEGITEGHVRKWLVKDGDQVIEDESVVQVETDKAVVNVPAPISGTIKENVKEDTTVQLGDVIAYIGAPDELRALAARPQPAPGARPVQVAEASGIAAQQGGPSQAQASTAAMSSNAPTAQRAQGETLATPAIRKLAHDLGVDIGSVRSTGPGGRILDSDVRNAANKPEQPRPIPKFSEVLEEKHSEDVERVQMSQTRKTIAKNMELSGTIPRAVHMDLLNATPLFNIVAKEKPNVEKLGVKLTFLPFIIKAAIEAIKENPNFNSSYDRDTQEIILKKYYNIGLAASAPDGLKVIVIKNADKKSILELAREIQSLHKKILDQTISIEEMRDSTFTITNIGSLGGGFLSVPMINYPEVAILGIHVIRDWPMISDGQVKIGKMLPFSLSFDHRVVDGADAAKFGNAFVKYLEDPDFLEMLG